MVCLYNRQIMLSQSQSDESLISTHYLKTGFKSKADETMISLPELDLVKKSMNGCEQIICFHYNQLIFALNIVRKQLPNP